MSEKWMRGTWDRALDLLYPPALYCSVCGNLIDDTRAYRLCDHCVRHFKWDLAPPRQMRGLTMLRCVEYGLYERSMIFQLKYQNKRYLARVIGEIMADRWVQAGLDQSGPEAVIIPIPLSDAKERRRGFNQTALIGRYFAEKAGLRMFPHALVRTRDTRPMRGLSPSERESNIRGCFCLDQAAAPELGGRRAVVIDDFFTTGATAREAARAIREGAADLPEEGPADVIFFAFAARFGEALTGRDERGIQAPVMEDEEEDGL